MSIDTAESVSSPGLLRRLTPEVLRATAYRRLWWAGILYYQAHWTEIVVTGWMVLTVTGSASAVGLVAFFRTLPMLIFGLAFGSLADRFSRMTVLFTIQLVGLLAALAFAFMFFSGNEQLWLICLLSGIVGCAFAADFAARRALVAELNTKENTASAMSLEALSLQGGKIVAPLAGGFVLGIGGATSAYLLMAALFGSGLIAVIRLSRIHKAPNRRPVSTAPLLELIRTGWSAAVQIPVVRLALVITVLMNLLVFPYQQLISLVAGEILSVGPGQMGMLAAAAGTGSAVMAGFLTFRSRPATARRFYAGGATLGAMGLVVLAISTNFHLSLTLQLAIGACFGAFGAMQPVLIVSAVEPEMRARAMGVLAMAIGTTPIGILLTGTLSSWIGPSWTIGGLSSIASVILVILLVRHRDILLAPN